MSSHTGSTINLIVPAVASSEIVIDKSIMNEIEMINSILLIKYDNEIPADVFMRFMKRVCKNAQEKARTVLYNKIVVEEYKKLKQNESNILAENLLDDSLLDEIKIYDGIFDDDEYNRFLSENMEGYYDCIGNDGKPKM